MTRSIAYDAAARAYARHRIAQDYAVEVLTRIRERAPDAPLLEVGCGTGEYVEALAAGGTACALGMDPSRGMLERARARRRVACIQGEAARLPFADGSLGMIFSINVIHHVADARAYMHEAHRALARGGIVCTATDSESIIRRRNPLSYYWPETVAPELDRYHSIESLRDAMCAAGFAGIEAPEAGAKFTIVDAGAYRDKAFSCLTLITEEAFRKGLDAIERDLGNGPLQGTSELVFLWGVRA